MRFIDFFAGIGGFRNGMQQAGHDCVGFCENDIYAVASYTAMYLATDDQMAYIESLPKSKRKEEILKSEYRNGEWFSDDIKQISGPELPEVDCWCFGAPCQNFSKAGDHAGLKGDKSSLVREIFRLLRETRENDRPEWLIYENVRGMLSSNRGWDFFEILCEMDRWGYDIEWQLFNSKLHGVPHNRERVYTIGHLRKSGTKKIFPISGTGREDCLEIKQIGRRGNAKRDNLNQYRVYDVHGIAPTLNQMDGGGREPHITVETKINIAGTLDANRHSQMDIHSPDGILQCLDTMHEPKKVVVDSSDPTEEQLPSGVYAFWNEEKKCYRATRKITPKECFRLQGFSDELFHKAELVNSDTQLYKQAGNSVTVNVISEIAKRL